MEKIEFTKEMALKMGRHEAMEQHCLVRYVKACRKFGVPQKNLQSGISARCAVIFALAATRN